MVYTPLVGGPQLLFLASTMNYIRTFDAKTGAPINSRQLHTPFLQSDLGCTGKYNLYSFSCTKTTNRSTDIANYIGIVGTPTIDPLTDIVYLYSKTYIPNLRIPGNIGVQNGVYYFHAINITTLADVYPPILIDGSQADNAPAKYFVGGIILQRPSLIQVGSVVYGAFGGHCDLFNYVSVLHIPRQRNILLTVSQTGLVIGIDVVKAEIITHFSLESGPLAGQTNELLVNGGGGGAGE